jgi:hypothetical protein
MSKEIVVRKNPLSTDSKVLVVKDDATIEEMYEEVLKANKLPREGYDKYFKVYIGGHEVYRRYWKTSKPLQGKSVLFAVTPRGGEGGQIFKQVAIITITAVVAVITSPAGGAAFGTGTGAAFGSALATAGAAIGSTLLFNALIPPLNNALGFNASEADGFSNSQSFSITNQNNQSRKLRTVPKVYGTHRIFPVLAANFYLSSEADPDNNGALSNYFYAIYDFGLGPLALDQFRIGETLLSEFSQVDFRLVDLNKPGVEEGIWDQALSNNFQLYKGDVTQQSIGVAINANENNPGPPPVDDYQVVRNATPNTNSEEQEISLILNLPNGLFSVFETGAIRNSQIDLKVEFAEVGTEDYRNFDDLVFVNDFNSSLQAFNKEILANSFSNNSFTLLSTFPADKNLQASIVGNAFIFPEGLENPEASYYDIAEQSIGILKGNIYSFNISADIHVPTVGELIYINGQEMFTITFINFNGTQNAWNIITTPAKFTVTIAYDLVRTPNDPAAIFTATATQRVHTNNILEDGGSTSVMKVKSSENGIITIDNLQTPNSNVTVIFKPKTLNDVKVRLTRKNTNHNFTFQRNDALTWSILTTRFDTNPIVTTKRHVFMEVRIKATDQLNGVIENLSAIATSVLDVYDGANWSKQITQNPAWVLADLLTGEVNKRAIAQNRLDADLLKEWADFCDEIPTAPPNISTFSQPRFQCNFVLDFNTTLTQLIDRVTNAAQARLTVVDGRYGVLIDRAKTTPVQVFTPRNSNNFSSTRVYSEIPDGLRINYVDAGSGFEIRQETVFNDGFDATTAVDFDELDTFAVTNSEQAFRFGRYMLAQLKLRQETITIDVDFEHLVCTRGDYVVITQDAMRVGGVPARVINVAGNVVTIDAPFATEPATSYGYRFRNATSGVTAVATMTITDEVTATLDGLIPNVGDLIIWGEISQVTYDCIVKTVSPNRNLTATLTLVEKNDAIFDAESSVNIPDYNPQLSTIQDENLTPPTEVVNLAVTGNTFDCDGNDYVYFIDLEWEAPTSGTFEAFEIYVNSGQGFYLDGTSTTLNYRHTVDQTFLGDVHSFKVLAVSPTGSKLQLGNVSAVTSTPTAKSTPPSDVDGLFINITNQTMQLTWSLVADCDVQKYQLRYAPSLTAIWEQSVFLVDIDKNTNTANVQARTGSYFIKVIDFNGNESTNEAIAITSIPELFDLNVIEETDDFPTLPGSLDRTVDFGGTLLLAETAPTIYEPEGFYFYEDFLDLGDIFTVRLQSLVTAEGFSDADLMVNWVTLDTVAQLATTTVADWDVVTEYRARDTPFAMANWTSLDIIDPISEGDPDDFTAWIPFTIGDFTGRIFQFRVRLISNNPVVTPRVFDAVIRSDMPDRDVSFENLTSVIPGSTTVTYSPGFKGPGTTPAIQITQDNASQGDYYVISNKTLDDFDIDFFDKNDVKVVRQFDVLAKGFGFKSGATI